MDDFSVMNVLHGKANLCEPVENLVLAKIAAFCILNLSTQISTICIVHKNIESVVLDICLNALYNVGMIKSLQNPSLFHCFFNLLRVHSANLNFLEDIELVLLSIVDKVTFSISSLAQDFDFLEVLALEDFVHIPTGGLI